MTIAHFSDTHLGFRQYHRTNSSGVNQRESDVMRTFQEALDSILLREPDLVVHGGDLFHTVRPTNLTLLHVFKSLTTFQRRRQGRPFVIISGNHDTPRMTDSGNILRLFESIEGIHVRDDLQSDDDRIMLTDLQAEILALPTRALERRRLDTSRVSWTPTQKCKHSILVAHGIPAGMKTPWGREATNTPDLQVDDLNQDRWTYVALGDYHIVHQVAPNVWYSGSTDFTSTNIWEEASQPKGWLWFDTRSDRPEFVPLNPRPVIDLPRIDARNLTPAEVTDRMLALADWDPETMPIVRQRIINAWPSLTTELDPSTLRTLQSRSLHYAVVTSRAAETASARPGLQVESVSVQDEWEQHVQDVPLEAGLNRDRIRTLGVDLLEKTREADTA